MMPTDTTPAHPVCAPANRLSAEREKEELVERSAEPGGPFTQALTDQVLIAVPSSTRLIVIDLGAGSRLHEADKSDGQRRRPKTFEAIPT